VRVTRAGWRLAAGDWRPVDERDSQPATRDRVIVTIHCLAE
jgi:hypothetical protein